MHELKPL